ncbi:MAG: regulatory protein RecX [Bacteroidota bacterium]|jgi:regulatory protein|nr:regulatory protein RecX [Bacteroidota bacterium]
MAENKQRDELLQRAMRACSEREYCISDIAALLVRWGADSEEMREWITERLVREKFIDEHRYCRAFVLDHFRHSQWGRVKISMALKQKRVDPAAISSGMDAIGEEEYLELLQKILGDQRRKIKSKSRIELKGKLLRHALGKGFESHLVYDAINDLFRE